MKEIFIKKTEELEEILDVCIDDAPEWFQRETMVSARDDGFSERRWFQRETMVADHFADIADKLKEQYGDE